MEYPQMYDYINKLDPYLKKHFNKEKEWIAMKKSEEAKSLIDTIKPFMVQESLEQLEAKFKEKDKRPSLDFGEEYALSETCFCGR